MAIVTEYRGMTVEEITKLRREIQKNGGDYMVTKNTLAKIAIKDTPYEILAETLKLKLKLFFSFIYILKCFLKIWLKFYL